MKAKKPRKFLKEAYRKFLTKASVFIFNLWIVVRDGKCVICGSTANKTCGHFVSALCSLTRYDERNSNLQCATHNYIHEFNPMPYTNFMIEHYGLDIMTELSSKRGQTYKYTLDELEKICIKYGTDLLTKDIPPEKKKNIQLILKRIQEYNSK